ncbi:MAG TPA: ribonuclease III [Candidatus Magasanikbacteria bacterium]|nr:ribonuclease III [Candidatus Magasanikbacteria bacterium]
MKEIELLEKNIGVTFKDKNLLKQSVTHRSYLNEHPDFGLGHNERLEFLGDAVLELVVTEYLFNNFDNPEGELTNWRASLVNAKILSGIAKDLGIEDFLFLSRGESKDKDTKARQYILANAIEAVIGAIYQDRGWDEAKNFIHRFVTIHLNTILENQLYIDPKSNFQELAQEKIGITPNYKVLKEEGPDHAKNFTVAVYLDKEEVAQGEGTSKQEAQTAAAREAIKVKGW